MAKTRRETFDMSRAVSASARRSRTWRHVCLTLAMLAVALKVLVPAGFMVGISSTRFPLVLCTGHGAVSVDAGFLDPGGGKKAPGEKPAHDAPCAFAGSAAAASPPDPHPVATVTFVSAPVAEPLPLRRNLAPGRGLAAPPLPPRGPPILLT